MAGGGNRAHLAHMMRAIVTCGICMAWLVTASGMHALPAPGALAHGIPAQRTVRGGIPQPPSTPIEAVVRTLVRYPERTHDDVLANTVGRFYADQMFGFAWVDERGFTPAAVKLQQAIATAAEHGLDPRTYPLPRLDSLTPSARARADVQLSLTALRFAQDLGWGLVRPGDVHRDHAYPRRAFAGDSLLHAWFDAPDAGAALLAVTPSSPGYQRLREALRQLRGAAARGDWQPMSAGPTLRPGSEGARVRELRARLVERGDLDTRHVSSDVFDDTLGAAVARFQERHGLAIDSVFGPATRAALNVPLATRLQQIALGMERVRWLPRIERGRWITVNLADQFAFLLEDGRPLLSTRVVIGDLENTTPMFVDTLTNIVLNPAWNVPPSIVQKEILPKLRRDPQYLERNHMVRIGGDIQQLPGPWNALGQIAFMFPNRFNVYMHDTPAKELFAVTGRTFSHGCIRVQRPHDLAMALLEPDGWTRARLDSVIATGARTVVWLRRPVPVRITYATAFVDDDGVLQFRRDVYGRDALLQRAIERAGGN